MVRFQVNTYKIIVCEAVYLIYHYRACQTAFSWSVLRAKDILQSFSMKVSGPEELMCHTAKTIVQIKNALSFLFIFRGRWPWISLRFLWQLRGTLGNLVLHAPARFNSRMEEEIKVVTLQQLKGKLKLTGFFPTMSFSTFWTWDTWSSLVLSSLLRIRSYIPTSISRGMSSPSSTPVRGWQEKRK